jgi:hypothetical protein
VINFVVIQSDKWNKFFPRSWPGYAIVKVGADFRPIALALGRAGGIVVGHQEVDRLAAREAGGKRLARECPAKS